MSANLALLLSIFPFHGYECNWNENSVGKLTFFRSVGFMKLFPGCAVCMAPAANAQADQIQALRHFHGYPLDFFLSR